MSSGVFPSFDVPNSLAAADSRGSWLRRFHARLATVPFRFSALGIFLLGLAPRLINLQQPLVENYIDRQVHTAMMARNLARGGPPLYPEIDIGPLPACYMLECPVYPALAAAVAAVFFEPITGSSERNRASMWSWT